MDDAIKLISALSALMYRLMTGCIHDSQLWDVERCIKIYLNRFGSFDEQVYPRVQKPKHLG